MVEEKDSLFLFGGEKEKYDKLTKLNHPSSFRWFGLGTTQAY
jgi:hypothetical protein